MIQKHEGNKQPRNTRGKQVQYKTSDRFGNGRWHRKYYADELNWVKSGAGAPALGIIDSYIVA